MEAAWEQWHHASYTLFSREHDLLVLATGELANKVSESWAAMLREALATTSERLIKRMRPPSGADKGSQVSGAARKIFASLHCPASLRARGASDQEVTVELIRRIRLLHFDFKSEPSRDQTRAVADCREVLLSSGLDDAQKLWERLVATASSFRATGGSVDLPKLLEILRPAFQLRDHPDYRSDWHALRRATGEVLDAVRTHVGNGLAIDRGVEIQQIGQTLEAAGICIVAGESGSGKSALAKTQRQNITNLLSL